MVVGRSEDAVGPTNGTTMSSSAGRHVMSLRSCCSIVLGLHLLCTASITLAEDRAVAMVLDGHELRDYVPDDPESLIRERIAHPLPMSIHSKPEWLLNVSRHDFDE